MGIIKEEMCPNSSAAVHADFDLSCDIHLLSWRDGVILINI